MSVFRERPYLNSNFVVDLEGSEGPAQAGFSEVILPASAAEVVEYRNGNEKENVPRTLPGLIRHAPVVLKRGLTGDLTLYEWWKQIEDGDPTAYREVTIRLLSENRDPVFVWKLTNAWPAAYRFSPLDARGEDVVMEIVELAYERLTVE